MDITVLKNLLIIARTSSLTVAAREANLSLQALAAQLKKAEAHFGFALFHRDHKGVSLTASGQQLLPYITHVVQSAGQLTHQAQKLQRRHVPPLHIALNNTFSAATNQRIIGFLTRQLAGYTLLFSASETPENLTKMASGEADMAVVLGDNIPQAYFRLPLPGLYIQVVAACATADKTPLQTLIRPQPSCAYAASFMRFVTGHYPLSRPEEMISGSEHVTLSLLKSLPAAGIISESLAAENNLHTIPGFSEKITAYLIMKNALLTASDLPDFTENNIPRGV